MSTDDHRSNTSPAVEHDPSGRPTTNFIQPDPPSETVPPTQVTTPPQQAATQPDTGGVQQIVVQPTKPSFNQQVVGYAKEIRGTILRKHDTKDYGGKIRKGEEPWPPPQQSQDDANPLQTEAAASRE